MICWAGIQILGIVRGSSFSPEARSTSLCCCEAAPVPQAAPRSRVEQGQLCRAAGGPAAGHGSFVQHLLQEGGSASFFLCQQLWYNLGKRLVPPAFCKLSSGGSFWDQSLWRHVSRTAAQTMHFAAIYIEFYFFSVTVANSHYRSLGCSWCSVHFQTHFFPAHLKALCAVPINAAFRSWLA